MQIELFLHKFFTALKRFPKHKSIFMRTDLSHKIMAATVNDVK